MARNFTRLSFFLLLVPSEFPVVLSCCAAPLCFYRSLPLLVSLVMLQILVSNDRCSKMKAFWTIFFVVCWLAWSEAQKGPEEQISPSEKAKSRPRSPVIQTKYGQVQGRILTFTGTRLQPVAVFKGIPYATPPVGSNRYY